MLSRINELSKPMSDKNLLTPVQVSHLKGVSRAAVYAAISEGRLASVKLLGRIGVSQTDAEAWQPIRYRNRPGAKGGRPPGTVTSEEARAKMSEAQRRRWKEHRAQDEGNIS